MTLPRLRGRVGRGQRLVLMKRASMQMVRLSPAPGLFALVP